MAARCETEKQLASRKVPTEVFKAKLAEEKRKRLEAFKDDLCQWMSNLLRVNITSETFLSMLDTGILLCKLANLIQKGPKARSSEIKFPNTSLKFNDKAEAGSFPARDNASCFISWCRTIGVEEAVIFESEGLVLHKDENRVILCLLDVARFAGRVGLSAPKLVQWEREIEEHEAAESGNGNKSITSRARSSATKGPEKHLEDKVLAILKDCKCDRDPLKTKACGNNTFVISDGNIRGERKLYARLLKDRVMVRVGGGWDTLEHFILEHDPCRIERMDTDEQRSQAQIVISHEK